MIRPHQWNLCLWLLSTFKIKQSLAGKSTPFTNIPTTKQSNSIAPTSTSGPSSSQSTSPTAEDKYTVGTTLVEFVGRSGQLRFCKLDDGSTTCNGRFVQLKMDRLREVDSTGTVTNNKVSSFASQQYTWSQPEEIDIVSDGTAVRGTKVSFTAELRVGSNAPSAPRANFFMETITYHTNGTAQNGNQTIFVPQGALKFTMGVENWPFLDAGNFLQFGIDVRANQRDGTDLGLDSATEASINQKEVQFNLGDGLFIGVPKTAVLDGAQRDIEAALDFGASRQSIDLTFPSFQTSLFYDPVVGAEEATTSSHPSLPPSSSPSALPSSEHSSKPSESPSFIPSIDSQPTLPPTMPSIDSQSTLPPTMGNVSMSPTIANASYGVGSTLVEFVGRSGQLRFCKLDDGATACNGRFVQLKMDRLREIDSSGGTTKNKVSAFASHDFTWSQPEEIDIMTNGSDLA